MRAMTGKFLEECRVVRGILASDKSYGFNGCFRVPLASGVTVLIQCSDGMGWEHVSVSIPKADRCPTWEEMCAVKDLFWDQHEAVAQFHPPKSEYVNNHNHCLHLWKPTTTILPLPDSIMVGVKGLEIA